MEIKNREYDSQILLAAEAVLRGYRVYLGTHAAIYALLKNKKSRAGIYLDKSTQPAHRMAWVRLRTETYCILDAELSPMISENILREIFPSWVYENSEKLIDKFFVVGPTASLIAKEYFKENSSIVKITGWPRIDIWEKYGSLIYEKEIVNIQKRYGHFFLFASNFGVVRDPETTQHLKNPDSISETTLVSFETVKSNFENFKRAVKLIKKWDSDDSFPPIVLRPHPSEPISVWKKELGSMKKTRIVSTGDITQWILASQGIIHAGSTSSIQAYYAKKPVFLLSNLTNPIVETMGQRISNYLLSSQPEISGLDFTSTTNNPDYSPNSLEDTITKPYGGSINQILNVFDDLLNTPCSAHRRVPLFFSQVNFKSLRRAGGLLKDELYWKWGRINIHSQMQVIPWGLDRRRIKKILAIDPKFHQIQIRRMALNLWEFDSETCK